jgi:phage-related minor tail protein
LESLRQKHRTLLDQKEDTIAQLTQLSNSAQDKLGSVIKEKEGIEKELTKLKDQLSKFKEDTVKKYEQFNKQCGEEHLEAERQI